MALHHDAHRKAWFSVRFHFKDLRLRNGGTSLCRAQVGAKLAFCINLLARIIARLIRAGRGNTRQNRNIRKELHAD
jgi:hypothetical protein